MIRMSYPLKQETVTLQLQREQLLALEDRAGCGIIALSHILARGKLGLCEIAYIYTLCSDCTRSQLAWEKHIMEVGLLVANDVLAVFFQHVLNGAETAEPKVCEGNSPPA